MKKNYLPIFFISIVIIGGIAFYAGMKYDQTKKNSNPDQRQQMCRFIGENPENFAGRQFGERNGANFLNGEIVAKDAESITIKLPDSGSKIVFFSDTTEIAKSVKGSNEDLKVGNVISCSGESNTDGSFTAKSIQLHSQIIPAP